MQNVKGGFSGRWGKGSVSIFWFFFGLLLAFHGEGGRYGGLCKVVLVQHEHETGSVSAVRMYL